MRKKGNIGKDSQDGTLRGVHGTRIRTFSPVEQRLDSRHYENRTGGHVVDTSILEV